MAGVAGVDATTGHPLDTVFARQQLPGATLIKGDSVSALVDGALAAVGAALDTDDGPFTLHAFIPDPRCYRSIEGRARLLGDGILAALRQRRRRTFRRYLPPDQTATAWPRLALLQAALVGRTSLLLSCSRPRALQLGGHDLAPWPAGVAPIEEDSTAPSRAYGKLEEGLAWLGRRPARGDTCVDLGGAPGGWAWTALKRGAQVVAVDRAPLAPPAAGHPGLSMVIGNAFTYRPPAPVDWLLCDVICEPARTIDLIERWMAAGLCHRVVATVKFKGRGDYRVLAGVGERLAAQGWPFVRIKHLRRHHNEVAILASR